MRCLLIGFGAQLKLLRIWAARPASQGLCGFVRGSRPGCGVEGWEKAAALERSTRMCRSGLPCYAAGAIASRQLCKQIFYQIARHNLGASIICFVPYGRLPVRRNSPVSRVSTPYSYLTGSGPQVSRLTELDGCLRRRTYRVDPRCLELSRLREGSAGCSRVSGSDCRDQAAPG